MRECKGRSLIILTKDYVSVDLETTGFSPEFDEIIEIACIRYRNGVETDKFQSLVRPLNIELVDDYITKLTGISKNMLQDAPTLDVVLPKALEFMADDIVVGHNASFDINFIYDNTIRLGLPPFTNNYIDTRRMCRRVYPNFVNYKLKTLIKEFNIPATISHRAEADARQTAECFAYMSTYISTNNLINTLVPHGTSHSIKASSIVGNPLLQDENNPLFGKVVVFTGTLEKMLRKDAMQIVADLGGINGDSITKKTNFLVLGNNDMCASIKNGKSNKHKKAEQYILAGADLMIINENVFYDMIEERTEVIDMQPAHQQNLTQPHIPAIDLSLTDLEQTFVQRISSILSTNPHFSDLRIEERSSNYLSVCLGRNDFLRFKFTARSKWLSLRLPTNVADEYRDNPLFAAQRNKAQFHWKADLASIDDLDKFVDLIHASCVN